MKFRHLFFILILASVAFFAFAQDEEKKPSEETKAEKPEKEFGPSWRDLGDMYYGKQDWVNAIYYMKRWLEADPRDSNTWYNLACTYGLAGRAEDAIDAFNASVETGWNDPDHPVNDSDLKIIWDDPRFKEAIERCKLNSKDPEGPKDYKRRYVELTRMGTYIAMLPPDYDKTDKKYPLVAILHGWGSTELGHGRLSDRWGRDDVIYIAIRYPYAAQIMLHSDRPGYSAYYDGEEVPEEYWNGMTDQVVDWVFACIDDAKKTYRVKGEKVFIFGHSQGAGLANSCGFMHPERIEAYVAYAGWLEEKFQNDEAYKKVIDNKTKVFLLHGVNDNVVPTEASIMPAKMLKEAGVDCTLKLVDSTHSFSDDVNNYMIYWLNKYVKGLDVKDEVPDAEYIPQPSEDEETPEEDKDSDESND